MNLSDTSSSSSSDDDDLLLTFDPKRDQLKGGVDMNGDRIIPWSQQLRNKAEQRRLVNVAHGTSAMPSADCWASFDFSMSPMFLSTVLHRNHTGSVAQELEAKLYNPETMEITIPWCDQVPFTENGTLGFRSLTQCNNNTYRLREMLYYVQRKHVIRVQPLTVTLGRIGYKAQQTCETDIFGQLVTQQNRIESDITHHDYRLVPLSNLFSQQEKEEHAGLNSRFSALQYLFHVDKGAAIPDTDLDGSGKPRPFFDLDLNVLNQLLNDELDTLPYEKVEGEDMFENGHGQDTDAYNHWKTVNHVACLQLRDQESLSEHFNQSEMSEMEKKLVRQVALLGIMLLQIEDYCAPKYQYEENTNIEDAESIASKAKFKDHHSWRETTSPKAGT